MKYALEWSAKGSCTDSCWANQEKNLLAKNFVVSVRVIYKI